MSIVFTSTMYAVITAVGPDSTVPDNPGAVDAMIFIDGDLMGSCTLLPDAESGDLVIWGDSIDCWADAELQTFLETVDYIEDRPSGYDRAEAIADIVGEVNRAASVGGTSDGIEVRL